MFDEYITFYHTKKKRANDLFDFQKTYVKLNIPLITDVRFNSINEIK